MEQEVSPKHSSVWPKCRRMGGRKREGREGEREGEKEILNNVILLLRNFCYILKTASVSTQYLTDVLIWTLLKNVLKQKLVMCFSLPSKLNNIVPITIIN